METTTFLEEAITIIVRNAPGITNQHIRKTLHHDVKCTKNEINKALHNLSKRNILEFKKIGENKVWTVVHDDTFLRT